MTHAPKIFVLCIAAMLWLLMVADPQGDDGRHKEELRRGVIYLRAILICHETWLEDRHITFHDPNVVIAFRENCRKQAGKFVEIVDEN